LASAEDLAHDFWSALCEHDIGRAAALLADSAVFHLAGMRPASGREAVASCLASLGEVIGSPLETIALYEEMAIVERVGRVAGEPADQLRVIVSLARVHDGRITGWQDFFDPAAYADLDASPDPGARRPAASKRAAAR
jgi:ketosteroid isomerase-like protein